MVEYYVGILLGIITRTFVPFLIKLKKNPRLRWKNYYLISALAGLVLALITAIIFIEMFEHTMGFWESYCSAFTLQSLTRETQKALGF